MPSVIILIKRLNAMTKFDNPQSRRRRRPPLMNSRWLLLLLVDNAVGDNIDPSLGSLRKVSIMPKSYLDFANVARAQEQHGQARDAESATVREGNLFFEDSLEERQVFLLEHTTMFQLFHESVLVDTNAHGADFMSILGQRMKALGRQHSVIERQRRESDKKGRGEQVCFIPFPFHLSMAEREQASKQTTKQKQVNAQ